jgi:hypothetical protein
MQFQNYVVEYIIYCLAKYKFLRYYVSYKSGKVARFSSYHLFINLQIFVCCVKLRTERVNTRVKYEIHSATLAKREMCSSREGTTDNDNRAFQSNICYPFLLNNILI